MTYTQAVQSEYPRKCQCPECRAGKCKQVEYDICPSCFGSGEGWSDQQICWRCKGSGETPRTDE